MLLAAGFFFAAPRPPSSSLQASHGLVAGLQDDGERAPASS
jgi:hypothetical protein